MKCGNYTEIGIKDNRIIYNWSILSEIKKNYMKNIYIAESNSLLIHLFVLIMLSTQAIRLSSNYYFTLPRCSVKNQTKKIWYDPESNLGLFISRSSLAWWILFSNIKNTNFNCKVY